jgi:hypothetical protein
MEKKQFQVISYKRYVDDKAKSVVVDNKTLHRYVIHFGITTEGKFDENGAYEPGIQVSWRIRKFFSCDEAIPKMLNFNVERADVLGGLVFEGYKLFITEDQDNPDIKYKNLIAVKTI